MMVNIIDKIEKVSKDLKDLVLRVEKNLYNPIVSDHDMNENNERVIFTKRGLFKIPCYAMGKICIIDGIKHRNVLFTGKKNIFILCFPLTPHNLQYLKESSMDYKQLEDARVLVKDEGKDYSYSLETFNRNNVIIYKHNSNFYYNKYTILGKFLEYV